MEQFIVVWLNHNTNTYYYKFSKFTYSKYYIGFYNQYNHEVVLLIPLSCTSILDLIKRFLKKSIKRIIRFLDKLQKRF